MTKPSSLSTCATFIFSRVAGMSTTCRSMRLALRMRVSMSARGSVIMACSSPARFLHTRDHAVAGQPAEADPADAELAVDGARPAAQLAAQPDADDFARLHQPGLVRLAFLVRRRLDLAQMPVEGLQMLLRLDTFGCR